jgi:ribokinase
MGSVAVVGSLNTDFVIRTSRLPAPGETVRGGRFSIFPGGKGANQAVAAARMGAAVAMIGQVGDDVFGARMREGLGVETIEVSGVQIAHGRPSGVAFITVDALGQNSIVTAPGANADLLPAAITALDQRVRAARVVLLQFEIPLETVVKSAQLARDAGAAVVLDPAPVIPVPDDLFRLLDVVTPNEGEAAALTGMSVTDVPSAAAAAARLRERGARRVLVKLGARGVWADLGNERFHVEGLRVATVDATAAGDAFNGALAALIAEGRPWREALVIANAAAALSTTRPGAQPSMHKRAEVKAFLAGVPGMPVLD